MFPTHEIQYDEDGFRREETYRETCRKCGGRGVFRGWSGQTFGKCFACKGVGYKEFRTDAATRAKARAGSAKRKQKRAEDNCETFAQAYPALWAWIEAKASSFGFASAMQEAVIKYGCLTEKQQETVERLVAKDAERQAQWKAEREARVTNAPTVSTELLTAAFDKAIEKGLKRPKLRFDGFVASLAPAAGKNAGAVYLKDGETYLGKIQNGRLFASRECPADTVKAIEAAMADPLTAAIAYGKRTGSCSCCGRELTDGESISRGIGPICAEKYAF